MDLVITTPGVNTALLRTGLDSSRQAALLVFDRATRCGSTTVDPTLAVRIRLAVSPCAVSLHAATRVRRRLGAIGQSVDGVVVSRRSLGSQAKKQLTEWFDCSVSVCSADEDSTDQPSLEYYD